MGGLGPGHKSEPPALKLRRGTQRKVPTGGTGARMGGLGPGHKSEPPALKLRRGTGGTGGEDGGVGAGAQIGEGEAGATRQYGESAGGEKERTAAMAERTGVADHRATGVAVVGGEQGGGSRGEGVRPPAGGQAVGEAAGGKI